MRLGDEPEQVPIPVEAPGATVLQDLQSRFVVPIEQFVRNPPRRSLVGQLQRLGAKPLYADDRNDLVRQDSPDGGGRLKVFEAGHVLRVRKLELAESGAAHQSVCST